MGTGGSVAVSPTGTLTSQTVVQQQQQYHQQYQMQQGQATDGTLHIDTSQRMLSPTAARSPGR